MFGFNRSSSRVTCHNNKSKRRKPHSRRKNARKHISTLPISTSLHQSSLDSIISSIPQKKKRLKRIIIRHSAVSLFSSLNHSSKSLQSTVSQLIASPILHFAQSTLHHISLPNTPRQHHQNNSLSHLHSIPSSFRRLQVTPQHHFPLSLHQPRTQPSLHPIQFSTNDFTSSSITQTNIPLHHPQNRFAHQLNFLSRFASHPLVDTEFTTFPGYQQFTSINTSSSKPLQLTIRSIAHSITTSTKSTSSHLLAYTQSRQHKPHSNILSKSKRTIYSTKQANPYHIPLSSIYVQPRLYEMLTGKPATVYLTDTRSEIHQLCSNTGVTFEQIQWALKHSRGDVFIELLRILIAHTLGSQHSSQGDFEPFHSEHDGETPEQMTATHVHNATAGWKKHELYSFSNIGINLGHLPINSFPTLAAIGKCHDPLIIETMRIIRNHKIQSLEHFDDLLIRSPILQLHSTLTERHNTDMQHRRQMFTIELHKNYAEWWNVTYLSVPQILDKAMTQPEYDIYNPTKLIPVAIKNSKTMQTTSTSLALIEPGSKRWVDQKIEKMKLPTFQAPKEQFLYQDPRNHQLPRGMDYRFMHPEDIKEAISVSQQGEQSGEVVRWNPQTGLMEVADSALQLLQEDLMGTPQSKTPLKLEKPGSLSKTSLISVGKEKRVLRMDGQDADRGALQPYIEYNDSDYAYSKRVIQQIVMMKTWTELIKDKYLTNERPKEWLHCTCQQPHSDDFETARCMLKPLEVVFYTAVEFSDSKMRSGLTMTKEYYDSNVKYPQNLMVTPAEVEMNPSKLIRMTIDSNVGDLAMETLLTLKQFVPNDFFISWLNKGIIADLYLRGQGEVAARLLNFQPGPEYVAPRDSGGYSWDMADAISCYFVSHSNEDFVMGGILNEEGYSTHRVAQLLSTGGEMFKYDIRGQQRSVKDTRKPLELIHDVAERLFSTDNVHACVAFLQFLRCWSLDEFVTVYGGRMSLFNVAARSSRINELLLQMLTFRDSRIVANNYMGSQHNSLLHIMQSHLLDHQRALQKARFIHDYCRAHQKSHTQFAITIPEKDLYAFARAFAEGKGYQMLKDPFGFAESIAHGQTPEELNYAKQLVLKYMNDPQFRQMLTAFRFKKLGFDPAIISEYRLSKRFVLEDDVSKRLKAKDHDDPDTTSSDDDNDVMKPFWLRGVKNPDPYHQQDKKKRALEDSLVDEAERQLDDDDEVEPELRELILEHVPFHRIDSNARLIRHVYGKSRRKLEQYEDPREASVPGAQKVKKLDFADELLIRKRHEYGKRDWTALDEAKKRQENRLKLIRELENDIEMKEALMENPRYADFFQANGSFDIELLQRQRLLLTKIKHENLVDKSNRQIRAMLSDDTKISRVYIDPWDDDPMFSDDDRYALQQLNQLPVDSQKAVYSLDDDQFVQHLLHNQGGLITAESMLPSIFHDNQRLAVPASSASQRAYPLLQTPQLPDSSMILKTFKAPNEPFFESFLVGYELVRSKLQRVETPTIEDVLRQRQKERELGIVHGDRYLIEKRLLEKKSHDEELQIQHRQQLLSDLHLVLQDDIRSYTLNGVHVFDFDRIDQHNHLLRKKYLDYRRSDYYVTSHSRFPRGRQLYHETLFDQIQQDILEYAQGHWDATNTANDVIVFAPDSQVMLSVDEMMEAYLSNHETLRDTDSTISALTQDEIQAQRNTYLQQIYDIKSQRSTDPRRYIGLKQRLVGVEKHLERLFSKRSSRRRQRKTSVQLKKELTPESDDDFENVGLTQEQRQFKKMAKATLDAFKQGNTSTTPPSPESLRRDGTVHDKASENSDDHDDALDVEDPSKTIPFEEEGPQIVDAEVVAGKGKWKNQKVPVYDPEVSNDYSDEDIHQGDDLKSRIKGEGSKLRVADSEEDEFEPIHLDVDGNPVKKSGFGSTSLSRAQKTSQYAPDGAHISESESDEEKNIFGSRSHLHELLSKQHNLYESSLEHKIEYKTTSLIEQFNKNPLEFSWQSLGAPIKIFDYSADSHLDPQFNETGLQKIDQQHGRRRQQLLLGGESDPNSLLNQLEIKQALREEALYTNVDRDVEYYDELDDSDLLHAKSSTKPIGDQVDSQFDSLIMSTPYEQSYDKQWDAYIKKQVNAALPSAREQAHRDMIGSLFKSKEEAEKELQTRAEQFSLQAIDDVLEGYDIADIDLEMLDHLDAFSDLEQIPPSLFEDEEEQQLLDVYKKLLTVKRARLNEYLLQHQGVYDDLPFEHQLTPSTYKNRILKDEIRSIYRHVKKYDPHNLKAAEARERGEDPEDALNATDLLTDEQRHRKYLDTTIRIYFERDAERQEIERAQRRERGLLVSDSEQEEDSDPESSQRKRLSQMLRGMRQVDGDKDSKKDDSPATKAQRRYRTFLENYPDYREKLSELIHQEEDNQRHLDEESQQKLLMEEIGRKEAAGEDDEIIIHISPDGAQTIEIKNPSKKYAKSNKIGPGGHSDDSDGDSDENIDQTGQKRNMNQQDLSNSAIIVPPTNTAQDELEFLNNLDSTNKQSPYYNLSHEQIIDKIRTDRRKLFQELTRGPGDYRKIEQDMIDEAANELDLVAKQFAEQDQTLTQLLKMDGIEELPDDPVPQSKASNSSNIPTIKQYRLSPSESAERDHQLTMQDDRNIDKLLFDDDESIRDELNFNPTQPEFTDNDHSYQSSQQPSSAQLVHSEPDAEEIQKTKLPKTVRPRPTIADTLLRNSGKLDDIHDVLLGKYTGEASKDSTAIPSTRGRKKWDKTPEQEDSLDRLTKSIEDQNERWETRLNEVQGGGIDPKQIAINKIKTHPLNPNSDPIQTRRANVNSQRSSYFEIEYSEHVPPNPFRYSAKHRHKQFMEESGTVPPPGLNEPHIEPLREPDDASDHEKEEITRNRQLVDPYWFQEKYLPMPGQPTQAVELSFIDLTSIIRLTARYIDPMRIKFILENKLIDPVTREMITHSPKRILQLLEPLFLLNLTPFDEQQEKLCLDRLYLVSLFINHKTKHLFRISPNAGAVFDEEQVLDELLDDRLDDNVPISAQYMSKQRIDSLNPMKYSHAFADPFLIQYFLDLGIPLPSDTFLSIIRQSHFSSIAFPTRVTSAGQDAFHEQLEVMRKLEQRFAEKQRDGNATILDIVPKQEQIFDLRETFSFLTDTSPPALQVKNHHTNTEQAHPKTSALKQLLHSPLVTTGQPVSPATTVMSQGILEASVLTLSYPLFAMLRDQFMSEAKVDIIADVVHRHNSQKYEAKKRTTDNWLSQRRKELAQRSYEAPAANRTIKSNSGLEHKLVETIVNYDPFEESEGGFEINQAELDTLTKNPEYLKLQKEAAHIEEIRKQAAEKGEVVDISDYDDLLESMEPGKQSQQLSNEANIIDSLGASLDNDQSYAANKALDQFNLEKKHKQHEDGLFEPDETESDSFDEFNPKTTFSPIHDLAERREEDENDSNFRKQTMIFDIPDISPQLPRFLPPHLDSSADTHAETKYIQNDTSVRRFDSFFDPVHAERADIRKDELRSHKATSQEWQSQFFAEREESFEALLAQSKAQIFQQQVTKPILSTFPTFPTPIVNIPEHHWKYNGVAEESDDSNSQPTPINFKSKPMVSEPNSQLESLSPTFPQPTYTVSSNPQLPQLKPQPPHEILQTIEKLGVGFNKPKPTEDTIHDPEVFQSVPFSQLRQPPRFVDAQVVDITSPPLEGTAQILQPIVPITFSMVHSTPANFENFTVHLQQPLQLTDQLHIIHPQLKIIPDLTKDPAFQLPHSTSVFELQQLRNSQLNRGDGDPFEDDEETRELTPEQRELRYQSTQVDIARGTWDDYFSDKDQQKQWEEDQTSEYQDTDGEVAAKHDRFRPTRFLGVGGTELTPQQKDEHEAAVEEEIRKKNEQVQLYEERGLAVPESIQGDTHINPFLQPDKHGIIPFGNPDYDPLRQLLYSELAETAEQIERDNAGLEPIEPNRNQDLVLVYEPEVTKKGPTSTKDFIGIENFAQLPKLEQEELIYQKLLDDTKEAQQQQQDSRFADFISTKVPPEFLKQRREALKARRQEAEQDQLGAFQASLEMQKSLEKGLDQHEEIIRQRYAGLTSYGTDPFFDKTLDDDPYTKQTLSENPIYGLFSAHRKFTEPLYQNDAFMKDYNRFDPYIRPSPQQTSFELPSMTTKAQKLLNKSTPKPTTITHTQTSTLILDQPPTPIPVRRSFENTLSISKLPLRKGRANPIFETDLLEVEKERLANEDPVLKSAKSKIDEFIVSKQATIDKSATFNDEGSDNDELFNPGEVTPKDIQDYLTSDEIRSILDDKATGSYSDFIDRIQRGRKEKHKNNDSEQEELDGLLDSLNALNPDPTSTSFNSTQDSTARGYHVPPHQQFDHEVPINGTNPIEIDLERQKYLDQHADDVSLEEFKYKYNGITLTRWDLAARAAELEKIRSAGQSLERNEAALSPIREDLLRAIAMADPASLGIVKDQPSPNSQVLDHWMVYDDQGNLSVDHQLKKQHDDYQNAMKELGLEDSIASTDTTKNKNKKSGRKSPTWEEMEAGTYDTNDLLGSDLDSDDINFDDIGKLAGALSKFKSAKASGETSSSNPLEFYSRMLSQSIDDPSIPIDENDDPNDVNEARRQAKNKLDALSQLGDVTGDMFSLLLNQHLGEKGNPSSTSKELNVAKLVKSFELHSKDPKIREQAEIDLAKLEYQQKQIEAEAVRNKTASEALIRELSPSSAASLRSRHTLQYLSNAGKVPHQRKILRALARYRKGFIAQDKNESPLDVTAFMSQLLMSGSHYQALSNSRGPKAAREFMLQQQSNISWHMLNTVSAEEFTQAFLQSSSTAHIQKLLLKKHPSPEDAQLTRILTSLDGHLAESTEQQLIQNIFTLPYRLRRQNLESFLYEVYVHHGLKNELINDYSFEFATRESDVTNYSKILSTISELHEILAQTFISQFLPLIIQPSSRTSEDINASTITLQQEADLTQILSDITQQQHSLSNVFSPIDFEELNITPKTLFQQLQSLASRLHRTSASHRPSIVAQFLDETFSWVSLIDLYDRSLTSNQHFRAKVLQLHPTQRSSLPNLLPPDHIDEDPEFNEEYAEYYGIQPKQDMLHWSLDEYSTIYEIELEYSVSKRIRQIYPRLEQEIMFMQQSLHMETQEEIENQHKLFSQQFSAYQQDPHIRAETLRALESEVTRRLNAQFNQNLEEYLTDVWKELALPPQYTHEIFLSIYYSMAYESLWETGVSDQLNGERTFGRLAEPEDPILDELTKDVSMMNYTFHRDINPIDETTDMEQVLRTADPTGAYRQELLRKQKIVNDAKKSKTSAGATSSSTDKSYPIDDQAEEATLRQLSGNFHYGHKQQADQLYENEGLLEDFNDSDYHENAHNAPDYQAQHDFGPDLDSETIKMQHPKNPDMPLAPEHATIIDPSLDEKKTVSESPKLFMTLNKEDDDQIRLREQAERAEYFEKKDEKRRIRLNTIARRKERRRNHAINHYRKQRELAKREYGDELSDTMPDEDIKISSHSSDYFQTGDERSLLISESQSSTDTEEVEREWAQQRAEIKELFITKFPVLSQKLGYKSHHKKQESESDPEQPPSMNDAIRAAEIKQRQIRNKRLGANLTPDQYDTANSYYIPQDYDKELEKLVIESEDDEYAPEAGTRLDGIIKRTLQSSETREQLRGVLPPPSIFEKNSAQAHSKSPTFGATIPSEMLEEARIKTKNNPITSLREQFSIESQQQSHLVDEHSKRKNEEGEMEEVPIVEDLGRFGRLLSSEPASLANIQNVLEVITQYNDSLNIKVREINPKLPLYRPFNLLTTLIKRNFSIKGNPLLTSNYRQILQILLIDVINTEKDGQEKINKLTEDLFFNTIEEFLCLDINTYQLLLNFSTIFSSSQLNSSNGLTVKKIDEMYSKILIKEMKIGLGRSPPAEYHAKLNEKKEKMFKQINKLYGGLESIGAVNAAEKAQKVAQQRAKVVAKLFNDPNAPENRILNTKVTYKQKSMFLSDVFTLIFNLINNSDNHEASRLHDDSMTNTTGNIYQLEWHDDYCTFILVKTQDLEFRQNPTADAQRFLRTQQDHVEDFTPIMNQHDLAGKVAGPILPSNAELDDDNELIFPTNTNSSISLDPDQRVSTSNTTVLSADQFDQFDPSSHGSYLSHLVKKLHGQEDALLQEHFELNASQEETNSESDLIDQVNDHAESRQTTDLFVSSRQDEDELIQRTQALRNASPEAAPAWMKLRELEPALLHIVLGLTHEESFDQASIAQSSSSSERRAVTQLILAVFDKIQKHPEVHQGFMTLIERYKDNHSRLAQMLQMVDDLEPEYESNESSANRPDLNYQKVKNYVMLDMYHGTLHYYNTRLQLSTDDKLMYHEIVNEFRNTETGKIERQRLPRDRLFELVQFENYVVDYKNQLIDQFDTLQKRLRLKIVRKLDRLDLFHQDGTTLSKSDGSIANNLADIIPFAEQRPILDETHSRARGEAERDLDLDRSILDTQFDIPRQKQSSSQPSPFHTIRPTTETIYPYKSTSQSAPGAQKNTDFAIESSEDEIIDQMTNENVSKAAKQKLDEQHEFERRMLFMRDQKEQEEIKKRELRKAAQQPTPNTPRDRSKANINIAQEVLSEISKGFSDIELDYIDPELDPRLLHQKLAATADESTRSRLSRELDQKRLELEKQQQDEILRQKQKSKLTITPEELRRRTEVQKELYKIQEDGEAGAVPDEAFQEKKSQRAILRDQLRQSQHPDSKSSMKTTSPAKKPIPPNKIVKQYNFEDIMVMDESSYEDLEDAVEDVVDITPALEEKFVPRSPRTIKPLKTPFQPPPTLKQQQPPLSRKSKLVRPERSFDQDLYSSDAVPVSRQQSAFDKFDQQSSNQLDKLKTDFVDLNINEHQTQQSKERSFESFKEQSKTRRRELVDSQEYKKIFIDGQFMDYDESIPMQDFEQTAFASTKAGEHVIKSDDRKIQQYRVTREEGESDGEYLHRMRQKGIIPKNLQVEQGFGLELSKEWNRGMGSAAEVGPINISKWESVRKQAYYTAGSEQGRYPTTQDYQEAIDAQYFEKRTAELEQAEPHLKTLTSPIAESAREVERVLFERNEEKRTTKPKFAGKLKPLASGSKSVKKW